MATCKRTKQSEWKKTKEKVIKTHAKGNVNGDKTTDGKQKDEHNKTAATRDPEVNALVHRKRDPEVNALVLRKRDPEVNALVLRKRVPSKGYH